MEYPIHINSFWGEVIGSCGLCEANAVITDLEIQVLQRPFSGIFGARIG